MDVEIRVITPTEAARILRVNNPKNRNIQVDRVGRYALEMQAGKWTENGDPVRFDSDGNLIDGQHRLSAVVLASMQQSFLVVSNVEHDAIYTIDTGKTRNAGDILAIDGGVATKRAQTFAAALKNFAYYSSNGRLVSKVRMTNAQVSAAYTKHETLICETADWLLPMLDGNIPLLPRGQMLSLAMIFMSVDEQDAHDFMYSVITGSNLPEQSPEKNLRDVLLRLKSRTIKKTNEEKMNTFIKAWNGYRGGRTQKSSHAVVWRTGDSPAVAQ
jgi:hypothetical protein